MKKIVFCLFALFFFGTAFAYEQSFLDTLKSVGFDAEEFQKNKAVSRYDLIKALLLGDCDTCSQPSLEIHDKLNRDRLSNFKTNPLNNFEDLVFENMSYDNKDYYYCLAYAGNQNYINGYPKSNPLCGGRFCGTNNATKGDAIEVGSKILSQYVFGKYSADRAGISGYLSQNKDVYDNFSVSELSVLNNSKNNCKSSSCQITSINEFNVYLKYCSYDPGTCNFSNFSNLSKQIMGEANILYKEGVVPYSELENISDDDLVDPDFVLGMLEGIYSKATCKFDTDYDKDGVKNTVDNCPYIYNPSQKDTDGNGKGDACSDDIDGDLIKNPVGIVDDKGNINLEKIIEAKKNNETIDNCLFVKNPNQEDSDNNGIGNVCQGQSSFVGLSVYPDSLGGTAPFSVNLSSRIQGSISDLSWDLGNGEKTNGKNILYTFENPGKYTVIGYSPDLLNSSKFTMKVLLNTSSVSGIGVKSNVYSSKAPFKLDIKPVFDGNISKISYFIGNENKLADASDDFSKVIETGGTYAITLKAYDSKGVYVGYSQFNLGANTDIETNNSSVLQSDNLKPKVGEQISLSTKISGFDESNISSIQWDFGDGTSSSNKTLSINKLYLTGGTKIINQKIYTNDNAMLENALTVYVLPKESARGTSLTSDGLSKNVLDSFAFSLNTSNISDSEIKTILWDFGDGDYKTYNSNLSQHKSASHIYYKAGNYPVKANIYLTDGEVYSNQIAVGVKGEDVCSSLNSSLKCKDKNGIPLICSEDIDGDGTPNFLGILKSEPSDCKITKDNINQEILNEEYDLAANGGNIDNCPFDNNSDQIDSNADGVGDSCKKILVTTGDNQNVDFCKDGNCVEMDNINELQSYVEAGACNQCPCPYADFMASVIPSDSIRVILSSASGKIYYRFSQAIGVQELLDYK